MRFLIGANELPSHHQHQALPHRHLRLPGRRRRADGGEILRLLSDRSAAILSDALESIINVVAAAFALWSIIFAARSPDPDHPYGHGKMEYFSAGFEGALIVLAALGIF